MKHKLLFLLSLLLLVVGVVTAAAETDKVMVVTYNSADEMLLDLNKAKTIVETPAALKTWTYCHKYRCYQVELSPVITPLQQPVYDPVYEPTYVKVLNPAYVPTQIYVQTYTRPEPTTKYRYNPVDGKYVNEWDEKEDRYRKHNCKYKYNRERRSCDKHWS